jgi:hypothetical protein
LGLRPWLRSGANEGLDPVGSGSGVIVTVKPRFGIGGSGREVPAAATVIGVIRRGGAVLFFVRVNQVLVRLWARVMLAGPSGPGDVPLFGCMSDRESGLVPMERCFAPQWLGGEGSEACVNGLLAG